MVIPGFFNFNEIYFFKSKFQLFINAGPKHKIRKYFSFCWFFKLCSIVGILFSIIRDIIARLKAVHILSIRNCYTYHLSDKWTLDEEL